MKNGKATIAVADGDGIGPEIMAATLHILNESGAQLDIRKIEIGEKVYLKGEPTGISASAWDTIRNTNAFLKAPITTPQGGGYRSLNVTVRTALGLYANVRPCSSYYPFVNTKHPNMDLVIVRENEEDLYTGVEYRQTPECYHALKIITLPGTEKIVRYAFEYARANGRKKVTCFSKDNILKLTDGIFHKVFETIAKEYPDIINEHWIVDIGAAKLADTPTEFDVIVMANLYGDILSDVAAQISGSVGLGGSANIGVHHAMFEAVHGSAPRRAGQNTANPSGLLLGAIQMLEYLGQPQQASLVHNAWLKTLEAGIHTYDIYKDKISKQKVGTKEFAEAVVKHLGQKPETLKAVHYSEMKKPDFHKGSAITVKSHSLVKETIGVDIFIYSDENVEQLQQKLAPFNSQEIKLTMISNRGVKVWPEKMPETSCVDNWRCRFMSTQKGKPITHQQIASLLGRLADARIDFTHTENLCTFDGAPGYTLTPDEQ